MNIFHKLSMDTVIGSCRMWIVFCLFRLTAGRDSYLKTQKEYCEFESMNAACEKDEVLVMDSARYGRMRLGRCVQADLGYVGCSTDVLDIADQLCSGRRECQIQVPNEQMKAKVKCLISELTTYLTASYSCHKALTMEQSLCRNCDFVRVSEPSGIIASVVTKESKCGSNDCPWLITVPKGQRINVTLLNFAWGKKRNMFGGHGFSPENRCRTVLATLKEPGKSTKEVCSDGERERQVYSSVSNVLEVRVVDRVREDAALYFFLKYQAVGCTDPMPPEGGWLHRTGEVVTAGCNDSSHTTQWTCTDNTWVGDTLQCGQETKPASTGYLKVGGVTLSYGWSVALIVVLAVFISLVILSVGLIFVRSRRCQWRGDRHHGEEPIYQPPPYMPANYRDPPPYYDKSASKSKQSGPREENGYTHIWQRPLPDKPEDSTSHTHPQQDSAYVQEPGSVHYGYNSIASVPRTGKARAKSRDSSLALTAVKDLKNNSTTVGQDCRYFQLDPDTMSNHVSA